MLTTVISISGASGAGKTTLEQCVTWCLGGGKVRTATTRPPRHGETKRDYLFVSKSALDTRDDVLWQVEIHGACYAAVAAEFERAADETDGVVSIVVTPEGHELVRAHFADKGVRCVRIHLEHPGDWVLRERLTGRGLPTQEINRRISDSHVFEEQVACLCNVHIIPNATKAQQCAGVMGLLDAS